MALINLRNALMAGKRLPYDAEVEWIGQTDNAQFIPTKIIPPVGSILRCRLRFTNLRNSFCAIGYRFALRFGFGIESGTFKVCTNGWSSTIMQPDTLWHDWEIDETLGVASIDGNSVSISSHQGFSGDGWDNGFTLFRRLRYDDSYDYPTYGAQCAGLYIGTANTVLFDGIPVRKGNVGYLYDRVSGKLFGNAGTGDFVLGPDVVPVEYIESHGTEYIDTGVIATNSHGFRVDVATAQKFGKVNTRIFGVHEGNVRCGFSLYGTTEPSGNDFFWGWNAATAFVADIPQRFVVSLNYKNDRAAIFNGMTNLSSLGTLGNTTKSIYLLNANYNGAPFEGQYVTGRLYKAEISIGSDISNNFLPVRVGTEGAMMDVLTRRIYRNAGTGAFTYGNDLKYPIPAE